MIGSKDRAIRQCYANIDAGLRAVHIPSMEVIAKLSDRVFYRWTEEAGKAVVNLIIKDTFSAWRFFKNHGATAQWSARENVPWGSMQIVLHSTGVFEVDYDICNPYFGAAPAMGHLVEILWPGKTDPWRVRKLLVKRGIEVPLC